MRVAFFLLLAFLPAAAAGLPKEMRFVPGPVNALYLGRDVAIYGGEGRKSHVLFTHARRDVVWRGEALVRGGASAIVPAAERELFEHPERFWQSYETARFHDYSQVNTKVLRSPLKVARAVEGGDVLELGGAAVEVMQTPGYTRGAVTYLVRAGGKLVACTGDLIYGDGQLFDLSSLQDAIPEAKARGYHGYAARAGDLIESLRKVAARRPDVLVPARGPMIANPQQAIDKLIGRLQALLASHFATDALRWYWGDDNLRIRSGKALDGRPVNSMPMAEQQPLPEWVLATGNSRVLLSRSGAAFVVDAGYKGLQPKLAELRAQGRVRNLDGIWITHYHDDHTDYAQETATREQCRVYFTSRMADVLARPGAYRLPCLTRNPVSSAQPQADGAKMRWQEFTLTFFDFPGQTLYHGGLLVERDGGGKLFFAGDSFTPSGMDDYCLQNRDFIREGEGFLKCLRVLESLPAGTWLINQHVEPTFRYSAAQIGTMRSELRRRGEILREMAPWPELNYAIDESWAAVYPYGSETARGQQVTLELRIFNHAARAQNYDVRWNVPEGWRVMSADPRVTIPARGEGAAKLTVIAAAPGLHVVTADVAFAGRQLREWSEGLVRVK